VAGPPLVGGEADRRLGDPVVSLEPAELLERIAATIRGEIAPAVDEEFPKTQAFMTSVILHRIAKQLALGPGHAEAEVADLAALAAELEPLLRQAPEGVREAAAALGPGGAVAELGPLIEALYEWGEEGIAALSAVRRVLRRDIDRRMEVAT